MKLNSDCVILFKNNERLEFPNYKLYFDGGWHLMRFGWGSPKELKPYLNAQGYYTVCLNGKNHLLSRVILSTFKGQEYLDRGGNLEVDHINRNPQDNRIENLRWATREENEHNKKPSSKEKNIKHCIEMAKNRCKPIYVYDLSGNFLKGFNSAREASKELGVSWKEISSCCRGKRAKIGNLRFSFRKVGE